MLIRGRQPMPRKSPGGRRRPPFREGFSAYLPPFLRFGRRSRLLTEDIPDTPGGVDKLGVPGVALNLLAEVADVYVDRAFIAEFVAPHSCEQCTPREYPPWVGSERHQELEFRVCQIDILTVHGDPTARQMDF